MRTQLAVAGVMGVAIWSLVAVNLTPIVPERTYFMGPVPTVLIVKCKDGEPCNAKKRIDKAKAKWAKQ